MNSYSIKLRIIYKSIIYQDYILLSFCLPHMCLLSIQERQPFFIFTHIHNSPSFAHKWLLF